MALRLVGRVLDNRVTVGYRVRKENGEQLLIGIDEAIKRARENQIEGVRVDRDGQKLIGINFKLSSLPSEKKDPNKGKKPTLQSKRSIDDRYNRIIGAAADDGTMQGILQGCRNMVLLSMPSTFKRKKCERFDAVEQTNIESQVTGNLYTFASCKMDGTMNMLKPIGEQWVLKLFVTRPGEKVQFVKEVLIREHDCKDRNSDMPMAERMIVVMDIYKVAKKMMAELEEYEKGMNRLY